VGPSAGMDTVVKRKTPSTPPPDHPQPYDRLECGGQLKHRDNFTFNLPYDNFLCVLSSPSLRGMLSSVSVHLLCAYKQIPLQLFFAMRLVKLTKLNELPAIKHFQPHDGRFLTHEKNVWMVHIF
jgi:hypothetical protein